jgi:hypothetical protein
MLVGFSFCIWGWVQFAIYGTLEFLCKVAWLRKVKWCLFEYLQCLYDFLKFLKNVYIFIYERIDSDMFIYNEFMKCMSFGFCHGKSPWLLSREADISKRNIFSPWEHTRMNVWSRYMKLEHVQKLPIFPWMKKIIYVCTYVCDEHEIGS